MDTLLQNLRTARRGLRGSPGFSAAVILTVALGVGLNTAMFGLVHAVLLSPLPYPDADRLTFISMGRIDMDSRRPLSGPELADLASGSSLHAGMGAVWPTDGTLVEGDRPEPVRVGIVTTNFLSLLGVAPVRGRSFAQGDEGRGAPPAIILSGSLWQSRFGGQDVIGRRLRLDGGWGFPGGVYTVVGVMPADFEMHLPLDASVPTSVDVWVPLAYELSSMPRGTFYLRVVGRLAPGATLADAQREVERVGEAMMKQHASYIPGRRFFAVSLSDEVVKNAKVPLVVLQAAVGLVLLIACANVANLMLVRAWRHRHEIGVRVALGAPKHRLASLLLTESLMLAAAGGLLGLVLSYAALRVLPLLSPETLPRAHAVTLNLPVLGILLLATGGCGLLFGLASFFQSWRVDALTMITSGGRANRGGAPRRWRHALVVAEVALSVVLSIGAGLLILTFRNVHAIDPGYRSDDVLTFKLSLPLERYGNPSALASFTREIESRLRALPGVEAAGAINQLPLDGTPNWSTLYRPRTAAPDQEPSTADARLVTPGHLRALRANLVQGRWLTEKDDETQPLVLMVDERLARKTWPRQSPLGQELSVQVWSAPGGFRSRWGTVVGVVRHLRHHQPSEEVREQVFVPFAQAPRPQMSVVVRSQVEPRAMMQGITRQLAELDPDLAPAQVRPLREYVGRKEAPARFLMVLAIVFAGFSLLLACLGMYGVISYSVSRRASELGVRAAMGARPSDLVRLVMGHGAILTSVGLAIGLLTSIGTMRWIDSLLFGVAAFNPATLVSALCLLGLTALLACYIPARRAAVTDPASILRME